MYNVICDSYVISNCNLWKKIISVLRLEKCSEINMCDSCTWRKNKLCTNYHHYQKKYKIEYGLRYYFKNLPNWMYDRLAVYSSYNIEVDMRTYFEKLYIKNTDSGHLYFKQMLNSNSIMNDWHTDPAFSGNKYWKILMYKILDEKFQQEHEREDNWWLNRRYAPYDLSVIGKVLHKGKNDTKSVKQYLLYTDDFPIDYNTDIVFKNIYKEYLNNASEAYYNNNLNKTCDDYDEVKYFHYISGKCVTLLKMYGVKYCDINEVLIINNNEHCFHNLIFKTGYPVHDSGYWVKKPLKRNYDPFDDSW